jgi:hypothetical protein
LAWNISKEDFLQSQAWISYLKLYASYGKNGNDNPGYFSYIQRYFDNTGAVFGTGAGGNTGVTEEPLANPNITSKNLTNSILDLQELYLIIH